MRATSCIALQLALAIGASVTSRAQIATSLPGINLAAAKGESVTLGAPTPGQQSLALVDGMLNRYASPFSITVSWDLKDSKTTVVKLVGYFATPAQALANGTDFIAAARIELTTDGGAHWMPVDDNAVNGVGSVGGSVVLYTSPVTDGKDAHDSHVVTFGIRINLLGAATTAAGTYSGTLNLMAISR